MMCDAFAILLFGAYNNFSNAGRWLYNNYVAWWMRRTRRRTRGKESDVGGRSYYNESTSIHRA